MGWFAENRALVSGNFSGGRLWHAGRDQQPDFDSQSGLRRHMRVMLAWNKFRQESLKFLPGPLLGLLAAAAVSFLIGLRLSTSSFQTIYWQPWDCREYTI